MILDTGICTIFRQTDTAAAGEMPAPRLDFFFKSWYGELNFETSPAYPTEGRRELRTDQRIRIMQNKQIRQNDVAVLLDVHNASEIPEGAEIYRIIRCFHGLDDDGPTPITDLSLEVTRP